jgi:putative SOS response-associated peptidase YedK
VPQTHLTVGQYIPVITETRDGRQFQKMFWGFTPSWERAEKGGMKPGNAKAETVSTTNMFRASFKQRRCVVPATGFFEWQGQTGSKELLPFTVPNQEILALPGVWDSWKMPNGEWRKSLAIITCTPNQDIVAYHDRMPVILSVDDAIRWISEDTPPDELKGLLLPLADGELSVHPELAFKPVRKSKTNTIALGLEDREFANGTGYFRR